MTSSTSAAKTPPLFITPKHLKDLLDDKAVLPLDATWFMPNVKRDAFQEFKNKRIPGARFWDADHVATKGATVMNLPHMMPSSELFSEYAASKGV